MKKEFVILGLFILASAVFAIQPAESWTVGQVGKYTQSAAANVTTEGGNVTELNLTSNISTEKWAGFWGSIDGTILLSPGSGLGVFYSWTWSPANGGEICAVAGPSGFDWVNVGSTTPSAIDNRWNFNGADTDSAANTFTASSCSIELVDTALTTAGATTGGTGFQTCAVEDGDSSAKTDYAFCVDIVDSGTLFNGQTGNYELLVPTGEAEGDTEQYFFWLELE